MGISNIGPSLIRRAGLVAVVLVCRVLFISRRYFFVDVMRQSLTTLALARIHCIVQTGLELIEIYLTLPPSTEMTDVRHHCALLYLNCIC